MEALDNHRKDTFLVSLMICGASNVPSVIETIQIPCSMGKMYSNYPYHNYIAIDKILHVHVLSIV